MAREPLVGGDNNTWGTVLNTFLSVSHNADGTLILNSSPGNINMDGTVNPGATASAADAGHIHPAPVWVPADNGLLAASSTLDAVSTGALSTAGTLYLNKIPVRYGFTTGTIWVALSAAGNAAPTSTGTFLGLYSLVGSTYTLVAQTSDVASGLTTTGAKSFPFTVTGAASLTAGQAIFGAILTNFNTTQPTFRQYSGASAPVVNLNLATTAARTFVNGTAFTSVAALPATLNTSTNAVGTANPFWMGLST